MVMESFVNYLKTEFHRLLSFSENAPVSLGSITIWRAVDGSDETIPDHSRSLDAKFLLAEFLCDQLAQFQLLKIHPQSFCLIPH